VPTPDPFEQSPIDDIEPDLEAVYPAASTTSIRGYHISPGSIASQSSEKSDPKVSGRSGVGDRTVSDADGGEESQLFPGSDLF